MLTTKQTEHLKAAMRALELLPSGAIGEHGATLDELERWHSDGNCWHDDAQDDGAQTAWRHLEAILAADADPGPSDVVPENEDLNELYQIVEGEESKTPDKWERQDIRNALRSKTLEGASEHFVNRLAERLEVSPMSRALDYRREWASMQGRDRTC